MNNAGAGLSGGFADANPIALENLLRLNSLAPTLLTTAVLGGMLKRGHGSIVNIASALAILPEYAHGIYAATKSCVLTMSQSLNAEVGPQGIYVQAVLPAATRTDISKVPDVMEVDDLVDAAMTRRFHARAALPQLHAD
ncbi:SDR family NAD(P)-dependent oxidoreductase [Rhizobium beringeri]